MSPSGRLAILYSSLVVIACGGVDELALNPEGRAGTGGMGQGQSTNDTAGTGMQGGSAGTLGAVASTGGSPGNPQPQPAQGGSNQIACVGDDDCVSVDAPRCDPTGRCVACTQDDDCGDGSQCDVQAGTCHACANGQCLGGGGSSSSSSGSGDAGSSAGASDTTNHLNRS